MLIFSPQIIYLRIIIKERKICNNILQKYKFKPNKVQNQWIRISQGGGRKINIENI